MRTSNKNAKKSYKYLERGEKVKYSLLFGETTDGYEWYEPEHRKKIAGETEKIKLSVILSMLFLLFATYLSGCIVSSDNLSDRKYEYPTLDYYEDGVYVAVGGDGGTLNELDYVKNELENEHEARINELATAYIEQQKQLLCVEEN